MKSAFIMAAMVPLFMPQNPKPVATYSRLGRRADNRQTVIGCDVRAGPAMLDGFNFQMLTCIFFEALVEHALVRDLCRTMFACDDDHGTLVGGRGAVCVHGVEVYEHSVRESPFGIQSQYIGACWG